MVDRERTPAGGTRSSGGPGAGERVPPWILAMGAVALVVVLAVVFVAVVPAIREQRSAQRATEGAGRQVTVTTAPPDDAATAEPSAPPSGLVAYADAEGRLLLGRGAEEPEVLATDVAVGDAGLSSVAIAPTGDLVAYVRADGALVVLPVPIGGQPADPLVLATDVALGEVGNPDALSWNATGGEIAYLAVGTEDMVEPRPEEPPPLSSNSGVFRVPLPEGELGNVVRVVDRTGAPVTRLGDPSTRSMVGVAYSSSDDLMLVESVAPDTGKPYTLALATGGSTELTPTVLSADEPAFAPDGNFIVAVGPQPRGQELLRVATDELSRDALAESASICGPSVSPDATRVVYGAGEDCSRLELVSSQGGAPVDITPPTGPGDAAYGVGQLGWTADGRYITFSDCRATDGPVRCRGPVTFLEPDSRTVIEGPDAATVAPVFPPLLQDVQLDLVMDGPLEYEATYRIDAELEGQLTELDGGTSRVGAELSDEDRSLSLDLQVREGANVAAGTITVVDPEAGIDRTFLVLASPSILGVRVVSLSGVWISTDEIPVISGEFRLAVRRR